MIFLAGVVGILHSPTWSRGATHRKLYSLAFYSRPSIPTNHKEIS